MLDRFVIRLQKDDKGLKPLPYVVWTDAASIPKPESINPFDESKSYDVNDVISYSNDTLMVCKNKPETGYSRDALGNVNLIASSYDSESRIFEYNGETFIVMTQSPNSKRLSDFTPLEPTGNEGEVYIFRWDIPTGALQQVVKLLDTPMSSLIIFENEGRVFFTGGIDFSIEHPTSKIWEFDGTSLSVVTEFDKADMVYQFRLGTREFLIGHNTNTKDIKMYQFVPSLNSIAQVTSTSIVTGEQLQGITHYIYRGTAYVFYAVYDTTRLKTDLYIYRFDNVSKTLKIENRLEFQDKILNMEAIAINSEAFMIVSGENSFVSVLQFYPEEGTLRHKSEVPKIFDHKGNDIAIDGAVFNFSFFDDGDDLYMNLPIYRLGDSHAATSVTCFWEPNEQQFVPFKGVETNGAYSWHVHKTDQGFFSFLSQHIKDDSTSAQSKIYGWDSTTKKFTTAFEEIAGGSIWNKNDWDELQTSTCLVMPFNVNHTYRTDMYILDQTTSEILRLKKPTVKGIYMSDDWEVIHPKQKISTMHFYQQYNSTYGEYDWSAGVLVQVTF